jgi:hypothetical protein
MADHLHLFYLIEGTTQPSYVSVPRISNGEPVMADTLRQTIFNRKCWDLAPHGQNLTLLKVGQESTSYCPVFAFGLTLLTSLRSTWTLKTLGSTCPYYD